MSIGYTFSLIEMRAAEDEVHRCVRVTQATERTDTYIKIAEQVLIHCRCAAEDLMDENADRAAIGARLVELFDLHG
jgi:hypothetical protein